MTIKETDRVPEATDGVPVVVQAQHLAKTREFSDGELSKALEAQMPGGSAAPGAPRTVVDDDVTVPVHSSIESSLTFEVLRRQSTDKDEDDQKPATATRKP
jgi:hypothetical protein